MQPAARQTRRLPGWPALLQRLFSPVDIASLVFFRVFGGIVLFWHVWLQMAKVRAIYIEPEFHFSYPGFGWVQPLPGEWMQVVFIAMAATTILIAVGLFYRYAAAGFFLLHTYVLLADQSIAWNHYYFISLMAFLMIFVPAHRALSLDVARGAVSQLDDVPSWGLWLLRAQLAIVYFFAGVAKLSSPDWLRARPMDVFLGQSTDFPIVGTFFDREWVQYVGAYSGMLFDLLIIPLMLWRPTRPIGLSMAVVFHLSNSLIFDIEVFPYLALAGTLLYLDPAWPRLGGQWRRISDTVAKALPAPPRLSTPQTALAALLAVYFLIQVVLPLRHFAFPGNPEWTRLGHFHSWRMLTAVRSANMAFYLTSDNPEAICEIDLSAYLLPHQFSWLSYPDGAVQFARYVGDQYVARGAAGFEINAWSEVRFNGRPGRALFDFDADLYSVSRPIGHASWLFDVDEAVAIERPEAERCPDPIPILRKRQIENVGVFEEILVPR